MVAAAVVSSWNKRDRLPSSKINGNCSGENITSAINYVCIKNQFNISERERERERDNERERDRDREREIVKAG